jgi:hypothetical protein
LGLVSGLERENGGTITEFAGEARPAGMQRLLNAARWEADTRQKHRQLPAIWPTSI